MFVKVSQRFSHLFVLFKIWLDLFIYKIRFFFFLSLFYFQTKIILFDHIFVFYAGNKLTSGIIRRFSFLFFAFFLEFFKKMIMIGYHFIYDLFACLIFKKHVS